MGIEILNVSGGRTPLVDKEVEKRSSANGPVNQGVLTPEEKAQLEERLKQKAGPQVKPWEPTLSRDEYLQLRNEGKSRKDIMLSWFNNEENKLVKQLREWELIDRSKEEEAMSKKQLDSLTRDQYLARRMRGETRTKIMKSLGVNTAPFYAKLTEWGLKEKAAEEKALAEMRPADMQADTVPAETQEKVVQLDAEQVKAIEEAAAKLITEAELDLIAEKDAEIGRLQAKLKVDEEENANLQAAAIHWQKVSEREKASREEEAENAARMLLELKQQKDVEIVRLEGIVAELTEERDKKKEEVQEFASVVLKRDRTIAELEGRIEGIIDKWAAIVAERDQIIVGFNDKNDKLQQEIGNLRSELTTANEVVDGLRTRVRELEDGRDRNRGYVYLRVPVLPGAHPIQQRIDTVNMVDRFAMEIESASMDRGRAAMELFQLVQTFVGLVYSELADLHPGGRNVVGYVKTFFSHYNQQHLDVLAEQEQAG